MKKYTRQRLILDLINNRDVHTQEELSDLLKGEGVRATQATISRDIKELRISKVQGSDGQYRYQVLDTVHDSMNERLIKIFRAAVLSVQHNGDMVVIQTIAYTAPVCGLTITNAKLDNISGIMSGHDTIFIVLRDKSKINEMVETLQELMG